MGTRVSNAGALALCILSATPATAAVRGFVAYDGDTMRATFRIANVDAPEIDGKCDAGRRLAIRARDFTQAWLAKGGVVISQTGGTNTAACWRRWHAAEKIWVDPLLRPVSRARGRGHGNHGVP